MGHNSKGRPGDSTDNIRVHFKPTIWFYLLRDMRMDLPDCMKMFHGYTIGKVGEKEYNYDCRMENLTWLN